MKVNPRKIITVISAAAVLLLGLDRIGVSPIAPGHNVNFDWSTRLSSTGPQLLLTTDAGDLRCFLRLKVRSLAKKGNSFEARLTNGGVLAVRSEGDRHSWWLEISQRSDDPSQRKKFEWPSGIDVVISSSGGLSRLVLEDWVVYLKDEESDSFSKARRRKIWFWISLVLVVCSVLGFAYGTLPRKAAQLEFTAQTCITETILRIEGSNPRETDQMRQVLRKIVLEGVRVTDALDVIDLEPMKRKTLWFKVRRQFLDRLTPLLADLIKYWRRLPR